MKQSIYTHTLTASLLLGGVAFAQDARGTDKVQTGEITRNDVSRSQSTNFHRDSEILGMDLWTTTGTEDGDKVDLGDLKDFVIDSKSGRVSHVIISSGGVGSVGDTLRAINWSDIQWSENEDGEKVAMINRSEKAFDALPEFDADKINSLKTSRVIEASAQRGRVDEARKMRASTNHLCSSICDLDVYGPGEEDSFTSVENCVINCDTGTVAYLTIDANDETYLVPFDALQIQPISGEEAEEEDIEFAVFAPHGEEALKGAPAIDMDANLNARNPEFRARVQAFYSPEDKGKTMTGKAKRGDGKY